MTARRLTATFCVLSFEGPDRYSLAGGLGVRVDKLTETLARQGFDARLLFVGDPSLPGHEARGPKTATLHRWCQWISAHHPAGVYDGEDDKVVDFTRSVPPYVLEHFIFPALAQGQVPVILAEEWHTAEAVIGLDAILRAAGVRDRCVLFWNANNTMSFHRVDWNRLREAATLTTVSRYMKHLMWSMGVNPLVIPNGIPSSLLAPVDEDRVASVRRRLDPGGDRLALFKIGRYDPAKRWIMAVEAAARLKERGQGVRLVMSGGIEPHRHEVLRHAHQRSLTVQTVDGDGDGWPGLTDLMDSAGESDVLELACFLGQESLRVLYRAADAVLANSGHEPFGLVALEAMAAGGIVYTGSTGEEYAFTPGAAVPVESDNPDEIVDRVLFHRRNPRRADALRERARRQAAAFTWEKAVDVLLDKVAFEARSLAGARIGRDGARTAPPARDVVVYVVAHQPCRVRLPAVPLPPGADADVLRPLLFDDEMNERYFRSVAAASYWPMVDRLGTLLDEGLRLAIGFSGSWLDQARQWDPALLDRFRQIVQHPHAELVAVEPSHSFVMLWDIDGFVERMRSAADRLEAVFGARPRTADTTEFMMSDVIAHALRKAGYEIGFVDGRPWVLDGRAPTTVFRSDAGLKLLARHHALSDDVGYRFSDQSWGPWPLMADQYAGWLAANPGDVVFLGWDFETFGEHHRAETGVFEFLSALPAEAKKAGLTFRTPSEAVARHDHGAVALPLPAFPATWAGSGGMEFFLGNPVQQAVLQLMMQACHKARLSGDPALMDIALLLAQSDNLHLIQWYGRGGDEAAVSAYFTPRAWWRLGPDGIVWEMQQVYKNFIGSIQPAREGTREEASQAEAAMLSSPVIAAPAVPGIQLSPWTQLVSG